MSQNVSKCLKSTQMSHPELSWKKTGKLQKWALDRLEMCSGSPESSQILERLNPQNIPLRLIKII